MRYLVLVDSSNLKYSAQANSSRRVNLDFEKVDIKIKEEVCFNPEEDKLKYIFYVTSPEVRKGGVDFLIANLKRKGHEVKNRVLKRHNASRKYYNSDWDAAICVDAFVGAVHNDYDTLILGSGDGDLMYLAHAISTFMNKSVIGFGFRKSTAVEIVGSMDRFFFLDSSFVKDAVLSYGDKFKAV